MKGKLLSLVAGVCVLVAACDPKPGAPLVAVSSPVTVPVVAQPVAPPAKPPLSIGPIHAGMTAVQIEALGFPFHLKVKSSYGIDYVVYLVDLGSDVEVSTWIIDGLSANVSTSSPAYLTAKGAHVGDTIARLRELYPAGEIFHGDESEVGLYYSFNTGEGEYFRFDADALGETCVVKGVGCPADMDSIRSVRLDVY